MNANLLFGLCYAIKEYKDKGLREVTGSKAP
jgi:hypothetical protein